MFTKNYLLIMTLFASTMAFAQSFEEEISPEAVETNTQYEEAEKIHTLTNGKDFEVNSCDHPLLSLDENSPLAQAIKEGRIEDAIFIINLGVGLGCKEYIEAAIIGHQMLEAEQSE